MPYEEDQQIKTWDSEEEGRRHRRKDKKNKEIIEEKPRYKVEDEESEDSDGDFVLGGDLDLNLDEFRPKDSAVAKMSSEGIFTSAPRRSRPVTKAASSYGTFTSAG